MNAALRVAHSRAVPPVSGVPLGAQDGDQIIESAGSCHAKDQRHVLSDSSRYGNSYRTYASQLPRSLFPGIYISLSPWYISAQVLLSAPTVLHMCTVVCDL